MKQRVNDRKRAYSTVIKLISEGQLSALTLFEGRILKIFEGRIESSQDKQIPSDCGSTAITG
jgi:hypothetical protein